MDWISDIVDLFKEKKYSKGDIIIKAGDLGNEFFIIKSGKCWIYSDKIDSFFTKVVSRGDYFGEASIVNQELRQANVVCLEDTVCLKINSYDFKWIFDSNATGFQISFSPLKLFENLFSLRKSQDAEIINQNKLISKMKEKEWCLFNMLLKIRKIESETILWTKGQKSDFCFFVKSG